ncbi:hypothetical protein [Lelliottia wanjuensis]|uniref:hypothetical protein n=1 Tax=Lelliottia wanjuensis TaxID=3050585 RepID=UPI0025502559|nr:hypothetical protein [Lelliottia sp. V86_10]MDK9585759.1 hypothetical protein [Lelliottia sp. V86_10]
MSISDTSNAKRYASIAEVAAASAKLSAEKLEQAPDYAAQAAASASAAASSAQVAISAESVVRSLEISASESATEAAASAAEAGNAASAAVGQCIRVPDGELIGELPPVGSRQSMVVSFAGDGSLLAKPLSDFAILDENGKIPVSQIPSIALNEPFVVSSQAEMLALDAQVGDIAKRTDLGYSFCLAAPPASTLSNWVQLTDDVLSQLGQSSGAGMIGALDAEGGGSTVQSVLNSKVSHLELTSINGAAIIGSRSSSGENISVQHALDDKVDSSELISSSGAELISNGESLLTGFLYHIPEEFDTVGMDDAISECFAASAADGRTIWIHGDKSLSSAKNLPDGRKILNDGIITSSENGNLPVLWIGNNTTIKGGKLISTGRSQAARSEGKKGFTIDGVSAESTYITSSTLPAYAFDFYNSTDFSINNVTASGYTGGVGLSNTNRVKLSGMNFQNMKYHPDLVAGGYGVLIQASTSTIVSDLFFKVGSDGYGRHGVYQSASGGVGGTTGGSGSVNTIVKGVILDYSSQPATVTPPGGINIRKNDRGIYTNVIIDGSRITANAENGNIAAQLITSNIVASYKHTSNPAYGVILEDSGSYRPRGNMTSNNLISVGVKAGSGQDTSLCYAIVVAGQDNSYVGNITNVPDASYPYLVRGNATNCLISGGMDYGPAPGNGVSFIIFEGTVSNIAIKGCKTNRPWFKSGNLAGVTDLTVDWSRMCAVAVNGGAATYDDANELIASTAINASNIVVTFNSHVTVSALATAVVSTRKTTAMTIPVITVRSGKTLTIELYSLATGSQINPTTTACAVTITLTA